MLPFKTLVVLTIVAVTLVGYGKSNAAPPAPSSSVVQALKEHASNLTPFKLHPFQATFEGTTVVGGTTLPAKMNYSLAKNCNGWILTIAFRAFIAGEDSLIRLDLLTISVEDLDGSSSYNQDFTRVASVEDIQSSNKKIISEESLTQFITKNREGFTIEFKEPAKRAQQSSVPALFAVEAKQRRLELIEQGKREFTYRQVDSSVQTLYTEEVTTVSLSTENSLQLKLLEIATDSYEIVDGERKITSRSFELANSNGFPVFLGYDFEGTRIEGWLTDFSTLQPEACSRE